MKKFICFVFGVFMGISLVAQNIEKLPYINSVQIVGFYSVGQNSAVLLDEGFRSIDRKKLFGLQFLGENIPRQEIAVDQECRLFAFESANQSHVFIFNGKDKIQLVYVSPNKAPVTEVIETEKSYQFKSVIESVVNEKGVMTLYRSYTKLGKDRQNRDSVIESGMEFLTVNPLGTKINIRREIRNNLANEKIVSFFPSKEGLAYVIETSDYKKKEYALNLMLCDEMGNLTGSRLLTNANTNIPSEVLADNGRFIVSGYYLVGNMYKAKKTEGLFIEVLDKSGNLVAEHSYDWDNLKEKVRGSEGGDFLFNGKMNIMVEHIDATETGYRIICENYTYGSGVTPLEFAMGGNSNSPMTVSVYDFVIFETNKNGEVSSVDVLKKETCNIEINTRMKSMPAIQITNMLKRQGVFPFQDVKGNSIQFVNYTKGIAYYSEIEMTGGGITEGKPVEMTPENIASADPAFAAKKSEKEYGGLGDFGKKLDRFGKKVDEVGGKAVYGIERIDRYFNPYEAQKSGYFILDDGRVISYTINAETFAIYYTYL